MTSYCQQGDFSKFHNHALFKKCTKHRLVRLIKTDGSEGKNDKDKFNEDKNLEENDLEVLDAVDILMILQTTLSLIAFLICANN